MPNLDTYFGRIEIVGVLAEHEREIRRILANEENSRMRIMLSKLWLLCDDNHYRHPSDAFLSGGYLNISVDPLADVRIPNLVSAKYLDGYDDKPEVAERIKRFLEAVMDCQKRCLSLTALRNEKLRYLSLIKRVMLMRHILGLLLKWLPYLMRRRKISRK